MYGKNWPRGIYYGVNAFILCLGLFFLACLDILLKSIIPIFSIPLLLLFFLPNLLFFKLEGNQVLWGLSDKISISLYGTFHPLRSYLNLFFMFLKTARRKNYINQLSVL